MTKVMYSRLPSQGVIYGFDKVAATGLFISAGVLATAMVADGFVAFMSMLPVMIPVALFSIIKINGQPLLTHLGREIVGIFRTIIGANKYRAKLESKKILPENVLNLPGKEGRLFVYRTESGAAVIWDSAKAVATITCVVATAGLGEPQIEAPSTISKEHRDSYIYDWSKVLGSFTQKNHIKRLAIIENTRPGSVAAEEMFFDSAATKETAVSGSYREALKIANSSVVMHRSQIAISFNISGEAKTLVNGSGGGKKGLLALAELEMSTAQEAFFQAGFTRVSWLNPREYAAWGRSIIDPAAVGSIDARLGTKWEGVDLEAATPMVVIDNRTVVETDSGFHRTYWINEWPRYETEPGFMSRLVFAKKQNGAPVRHTFMVVSSPVPVAQAMRRVEEEKRTWITNQGIRARTGKPPSAADEADWHAIVQHERELVAGQGELRFSAYLTVTALNKDDLERECATMLNACSSAGLEPRMIPWQQAEALMNVAFPSGLGMK